MKIKFALLLSAALVAVPLQNSFAESRYSTPPVIKLSPDLASPWLLQLKQKPIRKKKAGWAVYGSTKKKRKVVRRNRQNKRATGIFAFMNPKPVVRSVQVPNKKRKKKIAYSSLNKPVQRQVFASTTAPRIKKKAATNHPQIDPKFLPQMVSYQTSQKPGSIVIDTNSRYLYLVMGNGKARRYGVGVGKAGFEWSGTERITQKKEWPSWTPPKEMIERERLKGRELPAHMEGGPANPLGARALYLGSTLYRIHGTNQPWTIGQAVSSGCIRMRNQDVMDLYERVERGAKVIVT